MRPTKTDPGTGENEMALNSLANVDEIALKADSAHEEPRQRTTPETVDADSLRGFPELVRQLGGDPDAILQRAAIDPALLDRPSAFIEYRALLNAMQQAAADLDCPDFGLKLA